MKKVLLLLFISGGLVAQNSNENQIKKNSFGLSVGGMGLGFALNYSRAIAVKDNYFVEASAGLGTLPSLGGYSIPHEVTFNFGSESSFLELGIGGNYWTGESNSSGYTETISSYQIAPIIGWRKHFKNNLLFRVYANPLFHVSGEYYYENNDVVPYFGVCLGYRF